jgi:hypothetical protein
MDLSKFKSGETSESLAELAKQAGRRTGQRSIQILAGQFYFCPNEWADRAEAALHSARELILAFRLYRCWKVRPKGSTTIVCSNLALGIAPRDMSRRRSKASMLRKLSRAKLIRLEGSGKNQSPRIVVLETP